MAQEKKQHLSIYRIKNISSYGKILIDNKETNFNKKISIIGYCPQFDLIFDFMTV